MNPVPSAKTNLTVLAGAVVTIITAIITSIWQVEISPELTAAAVTLVTGLIAYLVPAKSGTYVELVTDEGWLPDETIKAKEGVEGVEAGAAFLPPPPPS